MTEREKMEQGLWYDANNDKQLLSERLDVEELCFLLNQTNPKDVKRKSEILKQLIPHIGSDITLLTPFYTDYGYNSYIGDHTFINRNAYLMDCATITIGKNCFIGPNFGAYTANHALVADERNAGLEIALPITIGDGVWIGGDVTILPGMTIGRGSVIGARSTVTKDIPENVIAVGNPCHVIRSITADDSIISKE